MKASSSSSESNDPWSDVTKNKDGILECLVEENAKNGNNNHILVQRVSSSLLEGSEEDDFDWCNMCQLHRRLFFYWERDESILYGSSANQSS